MEKLHTYPQIGEVLFRKRKGVKRISIRVHPVKGVSVTVPYMVPFVAAEAFLRLKREWVLATMTRQREKYCDITPADPQQHRPFAKQLYASKSNYTISFLVLSPKCHVYLYMWDVWLRELLVPP